MLIALELLLALAVMAGLSLLIIKITSKEASSHQPQGDKGKYKVTGEHVNVLDRGNDKRVEAGSLSGPVVTSTVPAEKPFGDSGVREVEGGPTKPTTFSNPNTATELAKQKAAEQKASEQKAAEQKAAEQELTKQELAKQKLADQKVAEQEPRRIKYINYNPRRVTPTNTYPLIRMPESDCPIKFPRAGHTGRRGASEEKFFAHLLGYFPRSGSIKVHNDRFLATGNNRRPYEPDLALLHEYGQNKPNIFLDIEIDEPYNGIYRQPIHCIGEDEARDKHFTKRGWIVLRFAEEQVCKQPDACCAFIARLIKHLDPSYQIPDALTEVANPSLISPWDAEQAQKWEKEKHREKYLDVTFPSPSEKWGDVAPVEDIQDDIALEALVKDSEKYPLPPPVIKPGYNLDVRASALAFDAEKHQYYINGQPATAVSTLYKRFFTPFPFQKRSLSTAIKRGVPVEQVQQEWIEKGIASATAGTALHQLIEQFYDKKKISIENTGKDFRHFLAFHNANKDLVVEQTEWRIYNEDLMLAGTVDFVARNSDGTLSIYDWKRSAKVVDKSGNLITTNSYQPNDGPLDDLADCSFYHYTLQLNLYKWMLEDKYGVTVRDMYLVVLHPEYECYYSFKRLARHCSSTT